MAQEYDNEKSGALFRNAKKTKEKQPDYNGNCTIEGVEYWISAWLKTSKAGKTFMSLAFQAKDGDGVNQERQSEPAKPAGIPPEDIPF